MKVHYNRLLSLCLSLLSLLSLCSCQDKLHTPSPQLQASSAPLSFGFACSSQQQGVLRSEWLDASLNTDAHDRVSQVRVLCEDPANGKLKSIAVYELTGQTDKEEANGPVIAPIEGAELTYYFIANEDPQNPLDTQLKAEELSLPSADLFAKTSLKAPNYMTAVYKVKRAADGSVQYRREYPSPHVTGQYKNAEVSRSARGEQIAIPVVLFPIRSRFQLDIDYDQAKKLGFTQENIQQQLQLKFGGFRPRRMLFTADYQAEPGEKAVSYTDAIPLATDLSKGGKQSYLYYLPATGAPEEQLEITYKQDGFDRKEVITAVTGTAPSHGFQYNTIYTLGVGFEKSYDLVIAPPSTAGAPNPLPLFCRAVDAPEENISNRPGDWDLLNDTTAVMHIGVGHKYMSFFQLKSMNAPAELEEVIDAESGHPEKYWITEFKELTAKPYRRKVDLNGNVYYYQTFCFKYNIDNPQRNTPLISVLRFRNRRDHSHKVDLHVSFNVVSRFAKLNLGTLNTFANGSSKGIDYKEGDEKNPGMLYQWGRNVPFDPDKRESYTLQDATYIGAADLVYSDIIYHSVYDYRRHKAVFPKDWQRRSDPHYVSTWWKLTEAYDSPHFWGNEIPEYARVWKDFVNYQNEQNRKNAVAPLPDSYMGNNAGDPCPPHYTVPLGKTLKALVYNEPREGEYYRRRNYAVKNVYMYLEGTFTEQGMNPSGNPKVESSRQQERFTGTYERDGGNLCYAIRFMPEGNNVNKRFAAAYKFEYIKANPNRRKYDVRITVIPLKDPDNTSMVDVKNPMFWGDYSNPSNPYSYNKYLIEELYFPHNYASVTHRRPNQGMINDLPDLWTGTSLPYASALDIDMPPNDDRKVTGPHDLLLPLRCQRD